MNDNAAPQMNDCKPPIEILKTKVHGAFTCTLKNKKIIFVDYPLYNAPVRQFFTIITRTSDHAE
jgi:hypothetical protein